MKKIKWIFIYLLCIVILAAFNFINGATIYNAGYLDILIGYLIQLFLTFCFTFPIFIVIFIAILKGIKNSKNKMGYYDFKKDIPYFRDIIDNYSISAVAANYDLCMDPKKHVVLNLMYLNSKNKIRFNNGIIEVIDNNTDNLDNVSAYILNNIKDGYVKLSGDDIFNFQNVYHFIRKEVLNSGLVNPKTENFMEKEPSKKKKIIFWIVEIILILIAIMEVSFVDKISVSGFLVLPVMIIMFLFVMGPFAFPIIYKLFDLFYFGSHVFTDVKYIFSRSNLGKDVMTKLSGLKNYMAEFTVMGDKTSEEIKLWNEYLIYSVLFGLNEQVFREYNSFIR